MLKSFQYTRYLNHLPLSVWNLTMICFVLSAFSAKENLAILLFTKENKNWTKDKIVPQIKIYISVPSRLPFGGWWKPYTHLSYKMHFSQWCEVYPGRQKESNSYTMFTWYQYWFPYHNENVDLVLLLVWTHTGMAHTVMRNCAVIT